MYQQIIGSLLRGAGAGLESSAAANEAKNMNQVTTQSLDALGLSQQQANDLWQKQLDANGYSNAIKQIHQGQQQMTSQGFGGGFTQNAPGVSGMNAQAGGRTMNQSIGGFGGYQNLGFQQGLQNQTFGNQMGLLSQSAHGVGQIYPTLLSGALNSQSERASAGQMLTAAGDAVTNSGQGGSQSPNSQNGGQPPPTSNQMQALNAGQGPMSQQGANQYQTQQFQQNPYNTQDLQSSWYTNPYANYGMGAGGSNNGWSGFSGGLSGGY